MNLWGGATQSNGATAYSKLLGSKSFNYDYSLDPPANDGVTAVLNGLIPDTNNTIYAVPTGGISLGTLVIASTSKLYVSDTGLRWARCLGNVPATVKNVKYNAGVWYVCGDSVSGSNFSISYDGINWGSSNEQTNPYINLINDIAFDSFGMGVAIGQGTYNVSLLLNNQVWMPVETDMFTANSPQLIINTTHWHIFAPSIIAESYNGITWTNTTSSYVPINPVAADWDKLTDTLAVLDSGHVYINVNGVWDEQTVDVSAIGATEIKFNGKYWLVSGTGTNPSFMSFTSMNPFTPMALAYSTATPTNSIAWNGKNWVTLNSSGTDFFINPGLTGSHQSGSIPLSDTYIKITSNQNFPYGGSVSSDPDPAVPALSYTPKAPVRETKTLEVIPVLNKINKTVAFVKDSLDNFDVTFQTDIYSPKNIVIKSLNDTFTFEILESANPTPFIFSSTTNQSNSSVFDFINDGVRYSQIYQFGSVYSSQMNTLNELKNFVNVLDGPTGPQWLNERLSGPTVTNNFTVVIYKGGHNELQQQQNVWLQFP